MLGLDAENVTKTSMGGPSSFVAHIANLICYTYLCCLLWLWDCSDTLVMSEACAERRCMIHGSESCRPKWKVAKSLSLNRE
jgi:hypothetical protein